MFFRILVVVLIALVGVREVSAAGYEQLTLHESVYGSPETLRKYLRGEVRWEQLQEDSDYTVRPAGYKPTPEEFKRHIISWLGTQGRRRQFPGLDQDPSKFISYIQKIFSAFRDDEDIRRFALSVFINEIRPILTADEKRDIARSVEQVQYQKGVRVAALPALLILTSNANALEKIRELKQGNRASNPQAKAAYDANTDAELKKRVLDALLFERTKISDPQIQLELISFLEDPDSQVIRSAVVALSREPAVIRGGQARVNFAVRKLQNATVAQLLVRLKANQRREARMAIIEVLGIFAAERYVDKNNEHKSLDIHEALSALLEQSTDLHVRRSAALSLTRMHPANEVSQLALAKALSDPDDEIRKCVLDAFQYSDDYKRKRIWSPKVEAVLVGHLNSPNASVRNWAANLLRDNRPRNLSTYLALSQMHREGKRPDIQKTIFETMREMESSSATFSTEGGSQEELAQSIWVQLTPGMNAAQISGLVSAMKVAKVEMAEISEKLAHGNDGQKLAAAMRLSERSTDTLRTALNSRTYGHQLAEAIATNLTNQNLDLVVPLLQALTKIIPSLPPRHDIILGVLKNLGHSDERLNRLAQRIFSEIRSVERRMRELPNSSREYRDLAQRISTQGPTENARNIAADLLGYANATGNCAENLTE